MKIRSISWKNICNKFYYRRNAVLYVGDAELHFCFIGEFHERKVKKLMDKYRNDIMKIW